MLVDEERLWELVETGYTRARPMRASEREPQTIARELLAARKLIEAYEDRDRVRQMNMNQGTRLVVDDLFREASKEWESLKR